MSDEDEPFRLRRNWLWALCLGVLGGILLAYSLSERALESLVPWAGVAGALGVWGALVNLAIIFAVLPYRLLRLSDQSVS